MRVHGGHWFLLMTTLLCLCCSISDKDRCSGGYLLDPDSGLCLDNDTGSDGDADTDTDTDTDVDMDSGADPDDDAGLDGGDGPDTADENGVATGLGEPCEDDDDCAEYGASTCGENPLPPYKKSCTKLDCVATECGDDYDCCDCSSIPELAIIGCLNIEDATLAALVGCVCK
jgi:hypothetical protein